MHPPCGPLSKRIRDPGGIAEILGILPEAYSEALPLVCWAYHQSPAEVPKNSVPLVELNEIEGTLEETMREKGSLAREELASSFTIFLKAIYISSCL